MKSFAKNETLKQLRNLLVKNIEKEGKLKKQFSSEFTGLLDELLDKVNTELEKGKTFDEIERTVTDFFIKKKEEVAS
jgi:fructose-1,6-bisphosphatase